MHSSFFSSPCIRHSFIIRPSLKQSSFICSEVQKSFSFSRHDISNGFRDCCFERPSSSCSLFLLLSLISLKQTNDISILDFLAILKRIIVVPTVNNQYTVPAKTAPALVSSSGPPSTTIVGSTGSYTVRSFVLSSLLILFAVSIAILVRCRLITPLMFVALGSSSSDLAFFQLDGHGRNGTVTGLGSSSNFLTF